MPTEEAEPTHPGRILAVHAGHSANCSSVGSVVDYLFLTAAASSAVLAAFATLVAAARAEPRADVGAARDGSEPRDVHR